MHWYVYTPTLSLRLTTTSRLNFGRLGQTKRQGFPDGLAESGHIHGVYHGVYGGVYQAQGTSGLLKRSAHVIVGDVYLTLR